MLFSIKLLPFTYVLWTKGVKRAWVSSINKHELLKGIKGEKRDISALMTKPGREDETGTDWLLFRFTTKLGLLR